MSTPQKIIDKPQEFAAIDLGSNSFHMVIARVVDGALQILGRLKQRVHLADAIDNNNRLTEEGMQRGLGALTLFAERLQGFDPANVTIVGTHTLRVVTNADEFLKRAEEVIPYPIEVIAGNEEARLIFMGVEHTQPEKGRKLVIDIGGGSTELVIGEDFEPQLVESRRMGCVSFSQTYFPHGIISQTNIQRARLAAVQKLETLAWQYRRLGWTYALGASGSIKAACEVLAALGEREKVITTQNLALLWKKISQFESFDSLTLPGLSDDRKSVFVPGLAILQGIFDSLGIQELLYSDGALREGVLYEMEGRFRHQDIRQRTAQSLANHYAVDSDQASQVLSTLQQLHQQWQQQNPKLNNKSLTALVEWAAMLHEVGLSINHSGMHRHSAYILQHSNMPGFSQPHQSLLSTFVRFHRKGIKYDEIPRFTAFKRKQFLPLIFLLRLATVLNNQRQATTRPEQLKLITDEGHWTLVFPKDYFSNNALVQLDLEKEQGYWQDVEGWQLSLTEESSPE